MATVRISATMDAAAWAADRERVQAAEQHWALEASYTPLLMSVLGMLAFHCPELMILDPGIAALMQQTLNCQATVCARGCRWCRGGRQLACSMQHACTWQYTAVLLQRCPLQTFAPQCPPALPSWHAACLPCPALLRVPRVLCH